MSATLVDANVLIDVLTEDDEWFDWSSSMLEDAAHQGSLIINPIIYAEVSLGFTRIEDLDEALPSNLPATSAQEPSVTGPPAGIKCRECGYTNDPTAAFCGVCGVDLA